MPIWKNLAIREGRMKKLLASLLCVVAIAFVALTPSKASAGWG